ncbi:hypothetical protein [Streptomyces bobili]
MKPAKRISTICAVAAAGVLLGGTAAHADGDGGLLGLGLLNTPSITLACFPAGQVGSGNSFTGNQNINCSQTATAPTNGNGGPGGEFSNYERILGPVFTVQAGSNGGYTLACPAGKKVLGGGVQWLGGDPNDFVILSSGPASSNESEWEILVRSEGGPVTAQGGITCANVDG